MLALLRRRVSTKILLGYLLALFLMILIGYVAVVQLNRINSTVGNLTNELAVERGAAQEMVSQVWLVRFYANKYVRTQNQADLDSFNTEFARLQDLLVQTNQLTSDAERQQKLGEIDAAVQEYGNAFQQVTLLIKKRQTLQSNTLDVQGLLVDNKLAALRISVNGLNDPQAFLAFGNAQTGFQQMRLNVVNYLATNDEGYIVLFNSGYQNTVAAFTVLESILDGASQENAASAREATETYEQGFRVIHADNLTLKDLFTNKLDVLEPQISTAASDIAANVTQEFQAENQSSQDLVSDTRFIVVGITLGAFVVVLSLGLWGSRRITTPLQRVMHTSQRIADVDLRALTTQLEALSQGDLRLNLTVTAQPLAITSEDEVGQMATAFNQIIDSLHHAEQAFQDMTAYLNRMADTATTVAQGDLNVDVTVQSETDILGNALASMVTNLSAAEVELRKHQEHLEELVAARTADLEAQQEARQALYHEVQREKQFLEALVLNSPVAIVAMDLDYKVVSWNPEARNLFGYSEDEAIGQNIDSLVTTNALQDEAGTYSRQIAEENTLVHSVTQRRRKDGTLVDVEILGVPVVVEGQQVGALVIYHDITELQRAREEAETANQAKSAFLAMMSHEIRTPMNGIIGMTSLLLDTRLDGEQRDYTETIRNSGEALLTIINDILDFSKIEAGKMELEYQPFDLRECVESALDLVVTQAQKKNLELAYLIDSHAPVMLMGDITRVRQILLNLLSNAIKFTEKGEVVIVVDVQPESGAEHVTFHFSVWDTGIGIPADRMDRLFQSFSQIDASTTRKYGGTGLGLVISKRLSELMGGTMWVESEVGKGSTFHFTIRAETAPAQARVYLRSEQPQLRDRRVLIVDDNETNRRVLVAQTRAWNMIPRETALPHEAIEWIRRGDKFDIALLDMQMPEMDGVTLATKIRNYLDVQALPIVMLSSLDHWETGAEVAQFAAYLNKPIKQSALYNTLLRIFSEQPAKVVDRAQAEELLFDTGMAERIPLHILVAEDNAINQKLALQMLRKMGYWADVAGNGTEVLQALERQPYDVILMDVQMPEMDGLEATRHIRQEWTQDRRRPHIIAMTANAMVGDREMCLAAGMDDYISKPIRVKELQSALERWGQQSPVQPAPASADNLSSATIDWAVLDELQALQEMGEPDFVQETITLYLADTPTLIKSLRQAVAQEDAASLRSAAHTLKGNSNSLGATRLGTISLELEKLGRSGTITGAEALLSELEREFERVKQALQSR